MPIKKSSGFSLVELMVALALGLLVLFAMVYVFSNSSKSYSELQKAAQQIENGRLAISLMAEDLRDAGQYGDFVTFPPLPGAPVSLPNPDVDPAPCPDVGDAGFLTDLRNAVPLPVQGYDNVSSSSLPGGLTSCLTSSAVAAVVANSDILVVRRGDTVVLVNPEGSQNGTVVIPATPVANEIYIQTNLADFAIQKGVAASIDKTKTAGNATATLVRKDFTTSPAGSAAGYIRKFRVHVYFVSVCADADCTASYQKHSDVEARRIDVGRRGNRLAHHPAGRGYRESAG